MSDALNLDELAALAGAEEADDFSDVLIAAIPALIQRVREAEAGPASASASEVTELRAEVAQLRRSRAEAWSQRDLARLTAEQDVEAAETRVAALSDAMQVLFDATDRVIAEDTVEGAIAFKVADERARALLQEGTRP